MGDVVAIKSDTPLYGLEATSKVIAWLREQADALEKGESRPAHKAVLTIFEDCSGQIRTRVVFCNTSTIERAGIMAIALHDTISDSD